MDNAFFKIWQMNCPFKKKKELKVTFLKSQPTDDRPTPQSCDLHTKKSVRAHQVYISKAWTSSQRYILQCSSCLPCNVWSAWAIDPLISESHNENESI